MLRCLRRKGLAETLREHALTARGDWSKRKGRSVAALRPLDSQTRKDRTMAIEMIVHPLTLGKPFTVSSAGQVFVAAGALFECVGFEDYVRRSDGVKVQLAKMVAYCAECGELFEFRVSVKGPKFYPTRKCAAHRAARGGVFG